MSDVQPGSLNTTSDAGLEQVLRGFGRLISDIHGADGASPATSADSFGSAAPTGATAADGGFGDLLKMVHGLLSENPPA